MVLRRSIKKQGRGYETRQKNGCRNRKYISEIFIRESHLSVYGSTYIPIDDFFRAKSKKRPHCVLLLFMLHLDKSMVFIRDKFMIQIHFIGSR